MTLEITKTADAIAIRHTEHKQGVFFAVIALPIYIWAGAFFWDLFLKKHNAFTQLQTGEQVILVFLEIAFAFAAAVTVFYSAYLTSPLTIQPNGMIIRQFSVLSFSSKIGTPFSLEIIKYRYRSYEGIRYTTCFDLHLKGPIASHVVTVRGDPGAFVELANSAHIAIHYAPANL
jgi:uncharacterized membrane protein YwzB